MITFTIGGEKHVIPIDSSKTLRVGSVSPSVAMEVEEMTDEAKALGVRHAKITGKDMRDHWGPIVDRIADEISDPRDAIIETQSREIGRLRLALGLIAVFGPEAVADIARAALAGDSHDQ